MAAFGTTITTVIMITNTDRLWTLNHLVNGSSWDNNYYGESGDKQKAQWTRNGSGLGKQSPWEEYNIHNEALVLN